MKKKQPRYQTRYWPDFFKNPRAPKWFVVRGNEAAICICVNRRDADRVRSALNGLRDISEARERLHAKFGYVKGRGGKCACAYCKRDGEALGEMCAEYEMRMHTLQTRLDLTKAKRAVSPAASEAP